MLDSYDQQRIKQHIDTLHKQDNDQLRSAQRLLATIAENFDQDNQTSVLNAITQHFCQALSHGQRVQVLNTVLSHFADSKYPCLAFAPNAEILSKIITNIRNQIQNYQRNWYGGRKYTYGTAQEITTITNLLTRIEIALTTVGIPEKATFPLSDTMRDFLMKLTDKEFGDLIEILVEMRDVKLCRKHLSAIDESYFTTKKAKTLFGTDKEHPALQKSSPELEAELMYLDFRQLNWLIQIVSNFRAARFQQGTINDPSIIWPFE